MFYDFLRLSNFEEYELGTNPNEIDTDGDGIPDGTDSHPNDPNNGENTDIEIINPPKNNIFLFPLKLWIK